MVQVRDIIENIIAVNKVTLFSKTYRYCPHCQKAKTLLKDLNTVPFVIELDVEANGAAIQQHLSEKTGQRTVPIIFIKQ